MQKSLGQIGYETFVVSGPCPGRIGPLDRRPLPSWDDLKMTEHGRATMARWEEAADKIKTEAKKEFLRAIARMPF